VSLSDLEHFGEPGALVYVEDCVRMMQLVPEGSVDLVVADPPYRLSNGGLTNRGGRLAPVDKGDWDRSSGLEADHEFNLRWLRAVRRILKPGGSVWVSGTHHIIFSLGFALQQLGFRVVNQIAWFKPNAAPNLRRTAFTHAHETLVWAVNGRDYRFNYRQVNSLNPGRQMPSVWSIRTVPKAEKTHGYHPTQKPLRLLRRVILASSAEGDLVFDPFTGSGTTAVAAKELNRSFVGAELDRDFARLAGRRVRATTRGSVLHRIPEAGPGCS
jgi:site-specific DNA-methyltransferase (adenine-specific)